MILLHTFYFPPSRLLFSSLLQVGESKWGSNDILSNWSLLSPPNRAKTRITARAPSGTSWTNNLETANTETLSILTHCFGSASVLLRLCFTANETPNPGSESVLSYFITSQSESEISGCVIDKVRLLSVPTHLYLVRWLWTGVGPVWGERSHETR